MTSTISSLLLARDTVEITRLDWLCAAVRLYNAIAYLIPLSRIESRPGCSAAPAPKVIKYLIELSRPLALRWTENDVMTHLFLRILARDAWSYNFGSGKDTVELLNATFDLLLELGRHQRRKPLVERVKSSPKITKSSFTFEKAGLLSIASPKCS